MKNPRSVDLVARRIAHELSERVHALEGHPANARRRFAFNELSDAVLTVLVTLVAPWNPADFIETQARIRELGAARQNLTNLRAALRRAEARGWLEPDIVEPLVAQSEELWALILLLASSLRRDRTAWLVS